MLFVLVIGTAEGGRGMVVGLVDVADCLVITVKLIDNRQRIQ